jgi:hypothetical protein
LGIDVSGEPTILLPKFGFMNKATNEQWEAAAWEIMTQKLEAFSVEELRQLTTAVGI